MRMCKIANTYDKAGLIYKYNRMQFNVLCCWRIDWTMARFWQDKRKMCGLIVCVLITV